MLRLLYHSPTLSIEADEYHGWLYANWRHVPGLPAVQGGCAAILDCLQQTGYCRILNDNRLVCSLWAEAAEWVGRTFMPQLDAAGVRHLAWINARSMYGRLSSSQAVAYTERPHTRLFDDYAEAVAWLRAAEGP
ncbi:hypothetical protein EJV47_12625 [Hymenobacter gummosus]|uniref:STAS/SEC14 domain-containing protein n=1 Tax=Hymenobacter gummosus TaxID=1776032 RepID=A0A431U2R9_9BACT|nr:hypothetical protein [Hymenobacter gummosus]RTQ49656.1 hypothetical protein EJV47_12625 [Hymenobacter gummosus]